MIWRSIKIAASALFVKFAFYLLLSVLYLLFLEWADLLIFSWKYVLVLTVSLLLFSLIFTRVEYVPFSKRMQ